MAWEWRAILSGYGRRNFDLVGLSLYHRAALCMGPWASRRLLLFGNRYEAQSRTPRHQRRLYRPRALGFMVMARQRQPHLLAQFIGGACPFDAASNCAKFTPRLQNCP